MTAADVPTAQYAQYSPLPYTQFHVIGTPAPQGSKRHVGKGIMVESSKAVGPWRDSVATQTAELMERYGWPMHVGPLVLTVTFWLRRPPSAPRRRIYPDRYPDLSKLTRATEDALVTAGIIEDDARIVELRVR